MKLQITKTINADTPIIELKIYPDNPEGNRFSLTLSYTCPECAGRGCNNHNQNNPECFNGSINQKLDPNTINLVFENEDLKKIRDLFQDLNTKIQKDAP